MHLTDAKQIVGWLKHTWIDARSRITSSIRWQRVNKSRWSSRLTALQSFVPAWLMACHSSPRLSMWTGDYKRVSRQERPAYPVACFLPRIENNNNSPVVQAAAHWSQDRLAFSRIISRWLWKSLTSQQQVHKSSNIFAPIQRNYLVIVWMWPRDIRP